VTKKPSKKLSKKKAAKSARRKKSAGSSKKRTKKKAASKKKAAASKKKPSGKKRSSKTRTGKKTSAKKTSVKKGATRGTSKQYAASKIAPKKAAAKKSRSRRSDLLSGPKVAAGPYQPKRGESYMNSQQLEHFRQLLWTWKRELMEEVDRTMLHMKDEAANFPDPNDRATQESEFGLELRTRDRERKLLRKIDAALQRIEDGTYGYCEETGEEIGLRRLEARPVATLCVEAQERRELAERQFRDREDQYR
jgi:DnaK suppressor protein